MLLTRLRRRLRGGYALFFAVMRCGSAQLSRKWCSGGTPSAYGCTYAVQRLSFGAAVDEMPWRCGRRVSCQCGHAPKICRLCLVRDRVSRPQPQDTSGLQFCKPHEASVSSERGCNAILSSTAGLLLVCKQYTSGCFLMQYQRDEAKSDIF